MKTYTVKSAAELLHCNKAAVYQKLRTGEIKGCHPGKHWIISEEDLTRFIRRNQSLPEITVR